MPHHAPPLLPPPSSPHPAGQPCPEGKFFGNFPYPYMNGLLHLGHAFSLSKVRVLCVGGWVGGCACVALP
jgi:hypothetical protein